MKNFRWGVLGTGGIARAFVEDLSRAEGHHVTAVGSRTFEKAIDFAMHIDGAMAYGSYL